MLNQSSQHAVRAMAHLAASEGRWIRAADLAEAADVPVHYLAKLLGLLVRAGLLEATRGKHGGYRLARPATQITLLEVVDTIEPLSGPRQCLLWRRHCDCQEPCTIHGSWSVVVAEAYGFLERTTLDTVVGTAGLALPGA